MSIVEILDENIKSSYNFTEQRNFYNSMIDKLSQGQPVDDKFFNGYSEAVPEETLLKASKLALKINDG